MGEEKYLINEYRTENFECRSIDYFVIRYSAFKIRNSEFIKPESFYQKEALTASTRFVPGAEIPEE